MFQFVLFYYHGRKLDSGFWLSDEYAELARTFQKLLIQFQFEDLSEKPDTFIPVWTCDIVRSGDVSDAFWYKRNIVDIRFRCRNIDSKVFSVRREDVAVGSILVIHLDFIFPV